MSYQIDCFENDRGAWTVVLSSAEGDELGRWAGPDLYAVMHHATASIVVRKKIEQRVKENADRGDRATLHRGDETWHDGPGWYYVDAEYPDEGAVGAFETEEAARLRARMDGYRVE